MISRIWNWLRSRLKKTNSAKSIVEEALESESVSYTPHTFIEKPIDEVDRMSCLCDRCLKTPMKFTACNDEEGNNKIDVYYHVIDRESPEPSVLMSSMRLAFRLGPDLEHPILKDLAFICCDCFDEMFGDQPDDTQSSD